MQISNQAVYSRNQAFSMGSSAYSRAASFSDVMSGLTSLQSSDTYQVFLPNENTAYSGGQANGLSYKIDYAENSTPENPIMIATGVDENGTPFEQELVLKEIDPKKLNLTSDTRIVQDFKGNYLLIFTNAWNIDWALEKNKGLELSEFNRS